MRKYWWFFLLAALFVGCVKEPITWYEDVGVVEVVTDTLEVSFNVPDTDTNGWNHDEWGEGQQEISITLKETAKKNVAVTELRWEFYDYNGNVVHNYEGSESYAPPIDIDGGREHVYSVIARVYEWIADHLDDSYGVANDFNGKGTIRFWVGGYDLQRGEPINCIPAYVPIAVSD